METLETQLEQNSQIIGRVYREMDAAANEIERLREEIKRNESELSKSEKALEELYEKRKQGIVARLNEVAARLTERDRIYQLREQLPELFDSQKAEEDDEVINVYNNAASNIIKKSLQAAYEQAVESRKKREEILSAQKEQITAGVVVYPVEESLEVYVSVPYEKQDVRLMGCLTEAVGEAILLSEADFEGPENKEGLVRLVVSNSANDPSASFIEALKGRNPRGFGEANIAYNVVLVEEKRVGKEKVEEGIAEGERVTGEGEASETESAQAQVQEHKTIKRYEKIPEGYVTSEAAAERFGKHRKSIYRYLDFKGGSIKSELVHIGEAKSARRIIDEASLEEFIASRGEVRRKSLSKPKPKPKSELEKRLLLQPQGGRKVEEIIDAEHIGIRDTSAITGRSPNFLYKYMDMGGGKIESKLSLMGERRIELKSLMEFVGEKFGETKMYTFEEGASIWQEEVEREFDERLVAQQHLANTLRSRAIKGELQTIKGNDRKKYFSNRELHKIIVSEIAKEEIRHHESSSIDLEELAAILGVRSDTVRRFISKGVLQEDEAGIALTSIKEFFNTYHYTWAGWTARKYKSRKK